jgi:hypothetical protein
MEVVSFTFRPLYPKEKFSGIHWREGWVGPRTGLDIKQRKISYPCRESNPDRPAP